MPKKRDGVWIAWKAAREVCRIHAKYGIGRLNERLGFPFANAFAMLAAACAAVELIDDYVLEIDRTAPLGSEDEG